MGIPAPSDSARCEYSDEADRRLQDSDCQDTVSGIHSFFF